MSWERDPLWAKARVFFERALTHEREDPQFGLWCALGLELLVRAAVASVSPTLLAEPDRGHANLLNALGRGDPRSAKSIGAVQALDLCQRLFKEFTPEHVKAASTLFSRRNSELHTGESAFEDYTTQEWLSGFYSCCNALTAAMGESLDSLFGKDEADVARDILRDAEHEVRQRVQRKIASYQSVFEEMSEDEREARSKAADEEVTSLSTQRHHRVRCPACKSSAALKGTAFGQARVSHDEAAGEIVVRQSVMPRSFSCSACGLNLSGYGELVAALLGNQYTRTTRYSPEEYYDLINPEDTLAIERLVEAYMESNYGYEYDNE
jgi:hypothetical protein